MGIRLAGYHRAAARCSGWPWPPAAVDDTYTDITSAGYSGRQQPYDAFWGARYAIVEDPDGNPVGLLSPIDAARKPWPPAPPPRAC